MSATVDPLVGRAAEMAELTDALDDGVSARGRLVLATGHPGIGKTRLADELAALAPDHGAHPLWGRCWEAGGAPPFWPWIEIIRDSLELVAAPEVLNDMGDAAPLIARLAPAAAAHVNGQLTAPTGPTDRFQLFDAVTTYLIRLSKSQPLLLIVDDLHAADLPSLRILGLLGRQVRRLRGMVYGTYRLAEAEVDDEKAALLRDAGRDGTLLHLPGLTPGEVGELTVARVRINLSDSLRRRLHTLTGGNPLFVSEMARMLVAGGHDGSSSGPGELPTSATVRHTVRGSLDLLSEPTQRVLAAASVFGRTFSVTALEGVADHEPTAVQAAVNEALALRILVREAGQTDQLAFSHALFAEVLYDSLPPAACAAMHLRAARALEALYGTRVDEHLAEVAHQFVRAAPVGGQDEALHYAILAAEQARDGCAHEEAVSWYERAIGVQHHAETPLEDRCDLLMELARVEARAGRMPQAREVLMRARELALSAGSAARIAEVALIYGWQAITTGVVDRVLVNLLEEALAKIDPVDSALRVDVMTRLVLEFLYADAPADVQRRDELAVTAVESSRRLGDDRSLIYALEAASWSGAGPDNVAARLDAGQEILRLAAPVQDGPRTQAPIGHLLCFTALLERGDRAGAERELSSYRRVAEQLGETDLLWYVTSARAALAAMTGELDRAEGLSAEAFGIGAAGRSEESGLYRGVQQLVLARERGTPAGLEAALPDYQELATRFPSLPMIRATLGCAYVEVGRTEAARAELLRILATSPEQLPRSTTWMATIASLIELCSLLDSAPTAGRLRSLLQPYAAHTVVFDAAIVCLGSAERYLGLAALTTGDVDGAVAHLDRAVTRNQGLGARPATVHSAMELAVALERRSAPGDARRATELRAKAREAAIEMGMDGVVRACDAPDESGAGADLVRASGQGAPASVAARTTAAMRLEGDFWTVQFGADIFRLRDMKGLHHLAALVKQPDTEIHVMDLMVDGQVDPDRWVDGGQAVAEGLTVSTGGGAGTLLDPRAKAAYRQRVEDLREEIEDAQSMRDPERAEAARQELDFLTEELARAVGLGGRDRVAASDTERARVNVTRTLRYALERIAEQNPALGQHLGISVNTGVYCAYRPDPQAGIVWNG